MSDCLFCKIANGAIPAQKAFENERIVAFHDINPMAPVHILIIPRTHIASVQAAEPADAVLLGELLLTAKAIAESKGFAADGYRLIVNTGANAGQAVPHLHVHLLAGRAMGWTPA